MPTCARCGFEAEATFRFCPECGTEQRAAPATHEQRKVVTVLFCDLAGSTALGESLDPERLRTLLARYFERMQAIVERHGGSVEKFIGDAVMAVFGVPVVREDDALRAARAAVEMRAALPELGLEGRIGVMTGEVVTGTEERLATGDPVNVAARLEQAAAPGEILIGQPTLALVRDAAEVEAVAPLALKGKADPVGAFRLLRVRDAPGRRHRGHFVGRREELALLRAGWERARSDGRCELITIVGEAGVGKSRLVAEALGTMEARVVQARCLPYGEGITYWPVVEVLKQLDVLPPNETAVAAIRSLLGESDAGTSGEEIAWAFRKTLEAAAVNEPVVVVFDDVQWGEQTFLDLVEHVALLSSGSAIVLLCVARPELTELRPAWPVTLRLRPLDETDVEQLIAERAIGALRSKIARAAGGNPLFVEEMLAISQDSDDVVVPPTLQAVLTARLDRLDPAERGTIERAAIEGEVFHRGAVQALAPDEPVTRLLAALVRKELIQPDRPLIPGEDGFRFRHLLIRDTAYDGLPKSARAELHVRFAEWLENHGSSLVELDEILAYHVECAHDYSVELGLPHAELAAAARRRLVSAGRRATARQDNVAGVRLLERAVALTPPDRVDVAVELELANALTEIGQRQEAMERAESLAARSRARGDRVGTLCGEIQAGIVRTFVEPEGATGALATLAAQALPELQAAGDDLALRTAYNAVGWVAFLQGLTDDALEAWERAAEHARRANLRDDFLGWRGLCRVYGTTPVPEALAWLDENAAGAHDHWLRGAHAVALAMVGRFEEARAALTETRAELVERGGGIVLGVLTGIESALVEHLAGDAESAAEFAAEGCRLLDELGDESFLSSAAGVYGRTLYALGRLDEAEAWTMRAADLGASDDAFNQMGWRPVWAKVLAKRGDAQEAERVAREAVAIGDATQDLRGQGDTYADLAEVLELAGKHDEAIAALEQALERYERKGNIVSAARTRARLAELAVADSR